MFINAILEISIRMVSTGDPPQLARIGIGGRHGDPGLRPSGQEGKRTKKGQYPEIFRHSSDPDADWYYRDKREPGRGGGAENGGLGL